MLPKGLWCKAQPSYTVDETEMAVTDKKPMTQRRVSQSQQLENWLARDAAYSMVYAAMI